METEEKVMVEGPLDEEKTVYELYKEGKLNVANKEYVVAIDRFGSALFKVYVDQIVNVTAVHYYEDLASDNPIQLGERYFVYHHGRRVIDTITKDVFDTLVNERHVKASYGFVDMGDKLDDRYAYSRQKNTPPTKEEVLKDRAERQKADDDEQKRKEQKFLPERVKKIERDPEEVYEEVDAESEDSSSNDDGGSLSLSDDKPGDDDI